MEESILKMDIFFIVTTLVTVVIGCMFALFFYYLIKVTRDISEITARVKKEAAEMVDDVREVRKDIKNGIETAKTYSKAVAGASIVKGVSNLMESFVEEKVASTEKKKGKKRKTAKKKAE